MAWAHWVPRDPELDRVVAVKVPRAGNLTSDADRLRFLREARSIAQIRHPSIVSVYEVGEAEGNPFLVNEFLLGVTLADRLTGGRLSNRPSSSPSLRTPCSTPIPTASYTATCQAVERDVRG